MEGGYHLEFAAVVGEIDYETFNSEITSITIIGEKKEQNPFFTPLNFTGRYGILKFQFSKIERKLFSESNKRICSPSLKKAYNLG